MNNDEIERLAELHLVADDDGEIYGLEQYVQAIERDASIRDLYAVVDNDAYAVSFQTMGQYRAALRSAIRALREAKP
jgi:hypothetical protein